MASTLCKTCLASNFGKVYYLKCAHLQEIFEKITNYKVNIKDGAVGLCYICYAKLLNCWRFYKMAHKSENMLKELFHKHEKITQDKIADWNRRLTLSITPISYFYNGFDVAEEIIKTEPVIVKEEIEDDIITSNEISNLKEKVQDITEVNSNMAVNNKDEMTEDLLISEEALNEDLERIMYVSDNFDDVVIKNELEINGTLNSDYIVNLTEDPDQYFDWGISVPTASEEIIIESDDKEVELEEEIDIEGLGKKLVHLNNMEMEQEDIDVEILRFDQDKTNIYPQKVNASPVDNDVLNSDIFTKTKTKTKLTLKKCNNRKKQYLICDICGRKFYSKDKIISHLRSHNESHTCALCDKRFKRLSYLKDHIKIHAKDYHHSCHCGKKFKNRSSFNRHKNRVHSDTKGIKKLVCNVCDKKFYNKYYLNSHMRIHTGEKPYKCNVCNKSFSQTSTLKWHNRIHTGEKTHFCELCGMSFYKKAHLHQHMSCHSDERPFICKPCGKSYKSSSALLYHMRSNIHSTKLPSSKVR